MRWRGTLAWITRLTPREPTSSIRPRRWLRSPMAAPRKSSGTTTSTAMIGSSRRGSASAQAVDDDLEVQLAHAADDGLPGLGVLVDAEGRILLDHLGQAEVEPLLLRQGLGLDGGGDHRLVGVDGLEQGRGRLGG